MNFLIAQYTPSIMKAPIPAKSTTVNSSGFTCTKSAIKKNPNNLTISLLFENLVNKIVGKVRINVVVIKSLRKRFFSGILKKDEAAEFLARRPLGRVSRDRSPAGWESRTPDKKTTLSKSRSQPISMCPSVGSLTYQGGVAAGFRSFGDSNRQSRRRGGFEKPERECQVNGFRDQSANAINAGQASDQRYWYSGYTANTTSHTALPRISGRQEIAEAEVCPKENRNVF